jgi:hypothetical protein
MIKRLFAVSLLVAMFVFLKPAPASAHMDLSVSIGLPFFGAVVGVPGPYCGPPVPAYVPAPVYVPPPVYGPGVIYRPRRAFVPAYPRYVARAYYRPRVVGRRFRHWW